MISARRFLRGIAASFRRFADVLSRTKSRLEFLPKYAFFSRIFFQILV